MATKVTKKAKTEVKKMEKGELEKELQVLQEQVRTLRFKGVASKNVKEISNLKKQVARILTALNK